MKDVIRTFDTLAEYDRFLQETPLNEAFEKHPYSLSSKNGTESFCGTKSWEDATIRMTVGDEESAKKIEGAKNGERVNANIRSTYQRPKLQRKVAGFMPCVPAYCAGARKNMFAYKKETKISKTVTIVYNISALAGVPSTAIALAAFKVLKAVLKIEASGTRVNFYTSTLAYSGGQYVGSVVKIKDSGQYFNFLKMAYPMVHPSMQRRQGFRFREVAEGVDSSFVSGYGSTVESSEALKTVIERNTKIKDAIFMGFYEVRYDKDEDVILERIKKKAKENKNIILN